MRQIDTWKVMQLTRLTRAWRAVWAFVLLTILSSVAHAAGCLRNVNELPWIADQGNLRAFSLARASALVSSGSIDKRDRSVIQGFAEIQRLVGFVEDSANNDIVVLGWTRNKLPALQFDDFVDALDNTVSHAKPMGCSIDPNPTTVSQLQAHLSRMGDFLGTTRIAGFEKEFRAICQKPQKVRLLELPYDSHAAKAMVDADYDMKLLADGNRTPKMPGLVSYFERAYGAALDAARNGTGYSSAAMNRFWFVPGQVQFVEGGGLNYMQNCPVTLLTENMALFRTGFSGSGSTDSHAENFAADLTAIFPETAQFDERYRHLENVFRSVALAKQMKERGVVGRPLVKQLVDHWKRQETQVVKTLPGRAAFRTVDERVGSRQLLGAAPSCGGVLVGIEPGKNLATISDSSGTFPNIRNIVLGARPSTKSLYWDLPEGPTVALRERARIDRINQQQHGISVAYVDYFNGNYSVQIGNEIASTGSDNPQKILDRLWTSLEKRNQKIGVVILRRFDIENKRAVFEAEIPKFLAGRKTTPVRALVAEYGNGLDVQLTLERANAHGIQLDDVQEHEVRPGQFRTTLGGTVLSEGRAQRASIAFETSGRLFRDPLADVRDRIKNSPSIMLALSDITWRAGSHFAKLQTEVSCKTAKEETRPIREFFALGN